MIILQMINKKKAQILLRNVVYSSLYNERDSNEGETSVCLNVFHNGAVFTVVFFFFVKATV